MATYDRAAAGAYTANPDYDLPEERNVLMQRMRRDLERENGVIDSAEANARWAAALAAPGLAAAALSYANRGPIPLGVGQDVALAATISDQWPRSNQSLDWIAGEDVGFICQVFPAMGRTFEPPSHLNSRPPCFPAEGGQHAYSPPLDTLTIERGVYWNCAEIPIILSGNKIVRDFNQPRARLAQAYDISATKAIGNAAPIQGQAIVLPDFGPSSNVCHWICDWLLRSAAVYPENCTALVPRLTQQWQRDTLAMIGFSRVVEVPRWTAVIADKLIVTSDQRDVAHPAFKAAPWAIDYLRAKLRPPKRGDWARKIYISREDAGGRKILNETAFVEQLKGYTKVVLSRLPIDQQAQLFAGATHVVAMHGAGLTHTLFADNLQSVVEIFAGDYGTPAFYVLAAAGGARYATYREAGIISGSRPQLDSAVLDIDDFMDRASNHL